VLAKQTPARSHAETSCALQAKTKHMFLTERTSNFQGKPELLAVNLNLEYVVF
jgi:hypothetical protein